MNPLLALEFLTVLRVRPAQAVDPTALARSCAWFPVVGALLGILAHAADHILAPHLPAPVVAAILLTTLVGLTGGLHLDGLADAADGLFGGHTTEQRLAIMDDPRLGSYGALALMSVLLLKWSAVSALTSSARTELLVSALTLGRFAMVLTVVTAPYVRSGGLWTTFPMQARGWPLAIAATSTAIIIIWQLGAMGTLPLVAAAIGSRALAYWMRTRLGGLTGDCYGAAGELTETLTLVVMVGWTR